MLPEVHSNSVCTYLTYHAAAVERSHIVMDNGDTAAAAATRYPYLRSRRKEDTLYTQGRLRSTCTCTCISDVG